MKVYWIEAKQLDRVTNFSSRTEIMKYAKVNNIKSYYYCTFAKEKKYFGLKGHVNYLGYFKNKYLKHVEFQIRASLKAIAIVLSQNDSVIMVNQYLIKNMLPALLINKLLKRKNKFITDIRTTPTNPDHFDSDMKSFHRQFKYAIKYFDGYSFITPFLEKYIMKSYNLENYKSVNWSSGVDIDLFNPENYPLNRKREAFRLFYHGGICISRGNLDLIRAAHQLKQEGYNIELVQVGITVDKEIKQYIKDNNLQSWCKLLSPVPLEEIPRMIAQSDLPIMPFPNFLAWRVSSPIKLMEYLAMGKKVMAPDMEAFTDVFGKDSKLVFYFDANCEDQAEAVKNSIKYVIDNKFLENGNNYPEAREFVRHRYTWEKQAEKLFNFCETL